MPSHTPIVLLGSERSGTNLLRALLSTHSEIASPPPCGILDTLAENQYRYLSPLHPDHMLELIEDVIILTQTHMNPWDIELNTKAINERINLPSFWGLFKVINEIYADSKRAKFWFSKEPGSFNNIYQFKTHLPNAKFIYMTRDGRDVAASMLKGRLHEFHIYNVAKRWAHEQRLCLSAYSDSMLNGQIFMLKYEDLIEDAKSVMSKLMSFLGLDFEEDQLGFYKNKDVLKHSEKSEFWKNLSKPIDKANKGSYRNSLSSKQIQIFESVAWNEMQALDYPLENSVKRTYGAKDKAVFLISEYLHRKHAQISPSEKLRSMKLRGKVISEIHNRTFEN